MTGTITDIDQHESGIRHQDFGNGGSSGWCGPAIEEAILEEMFPPDLLVSLGIDNTTTFVKYGTRAFRELKHVLSQEAKLS